MSTYVYLACLDHTPPLLAADESTQHRYTEHEMDDLRRWVKDRATLVPLWHGDFDYAGGYFFVNTMRFLSPHVGCRIAAQDEYGEWIDLGEGLPTTTRPGDVRGTDHTKETGDE